MSVCNDCGTLLKHLFGNSFYCPNDCDKKPRITATQVPRSQRGLTSFKPNVALECMMLVREIKQGGNISRNRDRLSVLLTKWCNEVKVTSDGKIELNLKIDFGTSSLPKAVAHGASKITVDTQYAGRKILKDVSRIRPIFT